MLVRWVVLLRRIGLDFQCLVPWHPAHSNGGATITTIHLRNFSSSQNEALHHETITLHGTWIFEDSCLFVMAVVVAEEGKNTGLRKFRVSLNSSGISFLREQTLEEAGYGVQVEKC